jgi:MFS family permease
MSRIIRALVAFFGGTVLTYVLVLVAAFSFWSVVPTPDPTKKIAATVFLIVGPGLALIGGLWLAAWAATRRAPWPATAWRRAREGRRRARAASAAAAVLVPAANAGERVVGWLFTALGGGGIALGIAGLALIGDGGDPWFRIPAIQLVPVFVLVVVGLLGPALLGGLGLLRGAVWGRPVVTVTAILMLFLVPLGTIAGLAALAVLHRRRRGGAMPVHGSTTPRGPWGDGEPSTCAHLAPIVQASKSSGLAVTPLGGRMAQVHGATYAPSVQRLLPDGSPVVLEQWPAPERSHLDPPRLVLHCRACDARLAFEAAAGMPERGPLGGLLLPPRKRLRLRLRLPDPAAPPKGHIRVQLSGRRRHLPGLAPRRARSAPDATCRRSGQGRSPPAACPRPQSSL